jgi:signal transduction histidine kinase
MKKLRISIFVKAMSIVIGIIIIYTTSFQTFLIPKIDKSFETIEQKHGKDVLNKVVIITKNVYRDLEIFKKDSLERHKRRLEDIIEISWGVVNYYYQQATPETSEQLKEEALKALQKLRYGNNDYIFVSDYKSVLISHPYLTNKDFSQVRDKKGELIVPPMVEIARKNGEGFHSYWWKKNSDDDRLYEKLSFSKDFPNWNLVIGTGVYIDDIEREVEKRKKDLIEQLQEIIETTKIGKTGYLYIMRGDGYFIIHPNSNLHNKVLQDSPNDFAVSLYENMLKAAKTEEKEILYKWDRPDDQYNFIYDKITWIEHIPEFDWYIGSSAYVEEFQESAKQMKDFTIILALLILIIASLYSFIFFRHLLKPITILSKLALQVKRGNYDVRADVKSNDEIGVLSDEFNHMVITIEDQIENLDRKIEEKTEALQKSNQNIQDSIRFASIIQDAILPDIEVMDQYLKGFFIYWKPKDIVGGDIYDVIELEERDELIIMVIDGAGHGVPGAFVTMLFKAVENQIFSELSYKHETPSPANILQYFNITFKMMLHQDRASKSRAGFDGGVLIYNRKTKECRYAGAKTPLYIVRDGKIEVVKSDRKNVGFPRTKIDQEYTEYKIEVSEGNKLYISTDGVTDQEGENDSRYGKTRLQKILLETSTLSMSEQKERIFSDFSSFKEGFEQSDDVTIVGIEI